MESIFTVVMPVYNAELYLRECLLSLAGQTLRDFELILVDDGSTDSSLEIARDLEGRFENLRIICQEHQYAGAARNRGIDLATGELVIFLDSDDVFEPALLENVARRMSETGADVCVFGAKRFREEPGDLDDDFSYLRSEFLPDLETFSCLDTPGDFFQITNPAPWTKAYRADFLRSINIRFQRHENAEDLFFSYAALATAKRICALKEDLVWYRLRDGSSQRSKKLQPLAFLDALVNIKALLIRSGTYDMLEETFLKMALANYEYNLYTAKVSDDAEAREAIARSYADYAAYELGLLRRQCDLPVSDNNQFNEAYKRMEELRRSYRDKEVKA